MSLSPFLIKSQIDASLLFKDLPEDARAQLQAIAVGHRFEAREVLIAEDDPSAHLCMLVTGKVRIWTTNEAGRAVDLKYLQAGHYFGEVGFLTGQPATANVEAIEPGLVLAFPNEALAAILAPFPHIKQILTQLTLHRAKDTIGKLARS